MFANGTEKKRGKDQLITACVKLINNVENLEKNKKKTTQVYYNLFKCYIKV